MKQLKPTNVFGEKKLKKVQDRLFQILYFYLILPFSKVHTLVK